MKGAHPVAKEMLTKRHTAQKNTDRPPDPEEHRTPSSSGAPARSTRGLAPGSRALPRGPALHVSQAQAQVQRGTGGAIKAWGAHTSRRSSCLVTGQGTWRRAGRGYNIPGQTSLHCPGVPEDVKFPDRPGGEERSWILA